MRSCNRQWETNCIRFMRTDKQKEDVGKSSNVYDSAWKWSRGKECL